MLDSGAENAGRDRAAEGAALFIAWRPGAPLVAVLLVGMVIAAATWRMTRTD